MFDVLFDGVDMVWYCVVLLLFWGVYEDFYVVNVCVMVVLVEGVVKCGVCCFLYIFMLLIYFDY